MRIASWNVNSVRVRLHALLPWLAERSPDVVLLQETKVVDDDFPRDELIRAGYSVTTWGQKTYNGVAILSRLPVTDIQRGLLGEDLDAEKRVLFATVGGLRVASIYVPNGKAIELAAFPAKLEWLGRLRETLNHQRARFGLPLVIGGDFNVAYDERDVYAPAKLEGHLHFHPAERARLGELLDAGFLDSFRLHQPEPGHYSWWDYRGPAFRLGRGLRIDYLFISADLEARCKAGYIDAELRAGERPSDHVPVVVELDD